MENDKSKFKNEFKKRGYFFVLRLIKFTDKLPKSSVSDIIGKQLLRSRTSILGNYIIEISNILVTSILTLKGKNNFAFYIVIFYFDFYIFN